MQKLRQGAAWLFAVAMAAWSVGQVPEASAWQQAQARLVLAVSRPQASASWLEIGLEGASSAPRAWLLKNGRRVASFEHALVRVNVRDGDLLAIDARAYPQPLRFRVSAATGNARTLAGTRVTTMGSLTTLGRVAATR